MQLSFHTFRRYDVWLMSITVAALFLFFFISERYVSTQTQSNRITSLHYAVDMGALAENPFSAGLDKQQWHTLTNPVDLGFDDKTYWFAFRLPPTLSNGGEYLLEIDHPLLDNVTVSFFQQDQQAPLATYRGGDSFPFAAREFMHQALLFPVPASETPLAVLLKVSTTGSMKIPLLLWTKNEFIQHTANYSLVMGVFFGFLLAMGVSNLFLFLTTRSQTFLAYSGYLFSLALALASLSGLAYAHLWPQWVWLEGRAVAIFSSGSVMFAMLFIRRLLELKQYSHNIDNVLKGAALLFLLNTALCFVLPYGFTIKLFLILLSVSVVLTLALGIWLALRGHTVARYFAFAWSILLISGFASSLDNLNVISMPFPSSYLLMLGAAIETLLLSLVVAISYNFNRQQLTVSKQDLLDQESTALKAKEDLMVIQQKYQDELEYKVQERTLELEIALRELSEANQELETLNSIDSLTGIRNRRYFDKRLVAESRRSRREETPLSLAIVDVDNFKRINDTFGHATGDACICHVANTLQRSLRRSSDDICRYGGEEFTIILPNTDEQGAFQVLEEMRANIEKTPLNVDGVLISMTVSAGVASAVITHDEHELTLLKQADDRLYLAKKQGRNRVVGITN